MKQVDINGEKEKMEKFLKQQDSDKYVKIFLIKITKKGIDLYKQEADQKTKKTLLKSIVESMEQPSFHKRDIKPYDPVITYKNVHEQVEVSEYENVQSVISQFNDEQQHLLSTSCETEKDLHNYLIEIKKSGVINLKFIGSFVNAFQLKKKMLFGNFTDSKIKLKERNNLFGLNKKIDLMIVNDEKILINQAESKFDSIFGMNKKFAEQATEILNTDANIKTIFEQASINFLKTKVINGKRLATRLIKIVSDTNRFTETVKHIDKIQTIKNDPNHKFYKEIEGVTFSNGKLSITDEKNCVQLINAISDALVTAYISEVETVEEGRM
ncbi:hypothetical protein K1I51_07215 [Streptococcus anginosus]|uniref:DUF4868 domain-containing protein n=2 Tax=Streptococcus anginosus TaxID=1328 RepID=A0AAP2P1S0_STRAP|nr:hypothetical protein [Streptococcus anginosus]